MAKHYVNYFKLPDIIIVEKGERKMEFKKVIEQRYSCKKYSDKQVETDKLENILNAGRLAPTAKNLQEQHVYDIHDMLGTNRKYE